MKNEKIARYTMRSTADIQAETHFEDGNFEVDAVDDSSDWCRGWEVEQLEMKNAGLRSWARAQKELCREYSGMIEKLERENASLASRMSCIKWQGLIGISLGVVLLVIIGALLS